MAGVRMVRDVKPSVRMLRRRSTVIRMQVEVLGRGLPCDAVIRHARLGSGSPSPSLFKREAQDLRPLSSPRILVWAASVGRVIVRTRFLRGAIDTISTSGTGTVASGFPTSADMPIAFVLRQRKNGAIRRDVLPWKTSGINARALGAFDG